MPQFVLEWDTHFKVTQEFATEDEARAWFCNVSIEEADRVSDSVSFHNLEVAEVEEE